MRNLKKQIKDQEWLINRFACIDLHMMRYCQKKQLYMLKKLNAKLLKNGKTMRSKWYERSVIRNASSHDLKYLWQTIPGVN